MYKYDSSEFRKLREKPKVLLTTEEERTLSYYYDWERESKEMGLYDYITCDSDYSRSLLKIVIRLSNIKNYDIQEKNQEKYKQQLNSYFKKDDKIRKIYKISDKYKEKSEVEVSGGDIVKIIFFILTVILIPFAIINILKFANRKKYAKKAEQLSNEAHRMRDDNPMPKKEYFYYNLKNEEIEINNKELVLKDHNILDDVNEAIEMLKSNGYGGTGFSGSIPECSLDIIDLKHYDADPHDYEIYLRINLWSDCNREEVEDKLANLLKDKFSYM